MKKLTIELLKEETLKAIKMAKEDFGVEIDPSSIDYESMLENIKYDFSEEEIKNKPVACASKEAFRKVSILI